MFHVDFKQFRPGFQIVVYGEGGIKYFAVECSNPAELQRFINDVSSNVNVTAFNVNMSFHKKGGVSNGTALSAVSSQGSRAVPPDGQNSAH